MIGPVFIGLLIVSPAASPAVSIWANNVAQIPKIHRLVVVAGVFAIVGAGVFWALRRRLGDSRVAAFITFFIVLALTSGGRILEFRPWALRWMGAVVVVTLVALIVRRLRHSWLLDAIMAACGAALLLPGLMSGIWASVARADPIPSAVTPEPVAVMGQHPDIVLVILDGYTSLPVLREVFGHEDPSLRHDLSALGFELVEPVFSPYSMTHLSVGSLLELDYLATDTHSIEIEDGRTLAQVIGGDSTLVDLLSGNGYRTTMAEPGWHMSVCGDPIDVCISDPFIDEGVGAVLAQSLVWSFLEPSTGSAFTHGARHAMSWTLDSVGEILDNGVPDFVFVHVLAPHPPLLLDSSCRVAHDRRLGGINMAVADAHPETKRVRLAAYVNQTLCVDSFVRDLALSATGTDSLVFVVGDHGSDVMRQLSTVPDDWSQPQILERMSVFLAVKAPPRCEDVSSLVTVPLFRSLVACAGDLDLAPVEEKAFLVSQAEVDGQRADMAVLDAGQLGRLASCLPLVDENLECR
jgi:hypothetical protein